METKTLKASSETILEQQLKQHYKQGWVRLKDFPPENGWHSSEIVFVGKNDLLFRGTTLGDQVDMMRGAYKDMNLDQLKVKLEEAFHRLYALIDSDCHAIPEETLETIRKLNEESKNKS